MRHGTEPARQCHDHPEGPGLHPVQEGDAPLAKDEETAAEMEDAFALHISIIATDILKREISICR